VIATGASVSLMKKIFQTTKYLDAAIQDSTNIPTMAKNTPYQPAISLKEEDNLFLYAMGVDSRPTVKHTSHNKIKSATSRKEKKTKSIPTTKKTDFYKSIPCSGALRDIYSVNQKSHIDSIVDKTNILPNTKNLIQNTTSHQPIDRSASSMVITSKSYSPPQTQIHLATGIHISVSSCLNLSGHTKIDANERLEECVLNGHALGWHNIHVLTGNSEEIRQIVISLLKGPTGQYITRYAQAPIPMGGTNAWILYF